MKDCILTNHLLVRYFNEKLHIYCFIVQILKALHFLNTNDEIHGDITPMSIGIQLLEDERLLKVKLLDYLRIRDLVDLAQNTDKQGTLKKQLPYDPPERKTVC